jgi:hypothetical protein
MLCLNRTAIVVKAKQPFLDWLRSVDPTSDELTLEEVNAEPTVYLLPECGSSAEAAGLVRRFAREIFAHELDGWWRDPLDWPKTLTFPVFEKWFGWRDHSVVLDLVKDELIREEF